MAAGLYVISGGKVQQCGQNCSVAANRAYLDLSQCTKLTDAQAAGGLRMGFSGSQTTGIHSTETSQQCSTAYDLSGRRVSLRGQHGVLIVDGRKVVR